MNDYLEYIVRLAVVFIQILPKIIELLVKMRNAHRNNADINEYHNLQWLNKAENELDRIMTEFKRSKSKLEDMNRSIKFATIRLPKLDTLETI